MRRFITILLAVGALAAAPAASGVNEPHPTLDAIATEVAGKPIAVWCENSEATWIGWELQAGVVMNGFTYLQQPVVFVSPRQCSMLRFGLTYGYLEAGIIPLTSAVLTLVHEAVHQRGIADEGATDCAALPLVVPFMERFFRLTPTVTVLQEQTVMVTRTVRKKIAGKWRLVKVRVAQTRVVPVTVANPDYARAQAWVVAWHRSKPPAYQGTC